jgi:hypothetical protein
MSYQLVFWRQAPDVALPARDVYESLLLGDFVPGLVSLPVEALLLGLAASFPTAVRSDAGATTFFELDAGLGVLEVSTSAQHLLVDCRGVSGEGMNRVIEVAAAYDCPLYDPQTDERFVPTTTTERTAVGSRGSRWRRRP